MRRTFGRHAWILALVAGLFVACVGRAPGPSTFAQENLVVVDVDNTLDHPATIHAQVTKGNGFYDEINPQVAWWQTVDPRAFAGRTRVTWVGVVHTPDGDIEVQAVTHRPRAGDTVFLRLLNVNGRPEMEVVLKRPA
jgi:hypothetical protein